MTSTTSPVKQRKLSDLRVADLQRELRSFEIFYDKKELKGSLLEKLRQVKSLSIVVPGVDGDVCVLLGIDRSKA